MEIRRLASNALLIAAAGLLLWQGNHTHPATVTALTIEPATTGSIQVTGSSAIRVQPDRVVVLFGIETFASTPSASQAQNARQSRAVIDAVRDLDIAQQDIATANFSIQPRYDDYDRNIISGYGSRNSIAVTLRDVQKLEPVLVAALEAGATTVDGIDFSVTNLRALRDRARTQAIQAALEKADDMAGAASMKLGNVTHISEDSWNYYFGSSYSGRRQWTNFQNVVQDLSAEGAITLEDGSISLGQIVVQAQVSITAQLVAGP
jgi:uncharacterized protein YggE